MRPLLSVVAAAALAASLCSPASAQPQRDALFLEWGGHGGFFTLSYERAVGRVSPRLGVGLSLAGLHAPLMATYRFSDRRGRFEAGAGAVLIVTRDPVYDAPVWPAATFGYRLDFADAPLAFRAAFTPMWVPGEEFVPWVGLGLGVSFDRRHAVLR